MPQHSDRKSRPLLYADLIGGALNAMARRSWLSYLACNDTVIVRYAYYLLRSEHVRRGRKSIHHLSSPKLSFGIASIICFEVLDCFDCTL